MIELSSGAVSVSQWVEAAQAVDPVVQASLDRVGRVIQTDHSSLHIQNTVRHQSNHYCCHGAYIALPISVSKSDK